MKMKENLIKQTIKKTNAQETMVRRTNYGRYYIEPKKWTSYWDRFVKVKENKKQSILEEIKQRKLQSTSIVHKLL